MDPLADQQHAFNPASHTAQPDRVINTLMLSFSLLFIISTLSLVLILFLGSRSMDHTREEESLYFARLELQSIDDDLALLAKDNSWWDEIILHSTPQPDLEWIRKTYIPYLWETLKISDMVVVDGHNRTLYAIHQDEFTGRDADTIFDQDTLRSLIDKARSAPNDEPEPFSGLTMIQGALHIVSACALTPEEQASVTMTDGPRPVLIFMRPFSTALFKEHSKKLILKQLKIVTTEPGKIIIPDHSNSLPLMMVNGRYAGYMTWKVEAVAQRMIEEIMPFLLLLLITMTGLGALVIRSAYKARKKLHILSAAIEQAGEAIAVTDMNGITTYANPAFSRLTGYSADEITDRALPFIDGSDHQMPPFINEIWASIRHGTVWQSKITDQRKDGSSYPAMMSVSPIYNDSGEISHIVFTLQEMSAYEKLEQRFRQAQKMEAVGILAGGIAHNFNSLLAGITGYAYLIKQETQGQPTVQKRIDRINEIGFQAAQTVSQLLTFARKAIIHKQPCNLHELLRKTTELIRVSIPENIRLELSLCEDELYVSGDANQIQQLLLNLANNARDALTRVEYPRLYIGLRSFTPDESFHKHHPDLKGHIFACLEITDSGIGMTDETRAHLFEPFFTTKEVGQGNGLGLAMVYGAVKTHEGAIEVESNRDEGTRISVYLPLLANINGIATSHENMHEEDQPIETGNNELILLVDDSPEVLDSLAAVTAVRLSMDEHHLLLIGL